MSVHGADDGLPLAVVVDDAAADLILVVSVDSVTNRVPQTSSRSSSLVTSRSRLRSRWTMTSNTCGSTSTGSPLRRSSKRS